MAAGPFRKDTPSVPMPRPPRRLSVLDEELCYKLATEQIEDTEVEVLDLSDLHGLKNIPPAIAACSKLRRLNLANTAVAELNVLKLLGDLRELNLWRCPVEDVAPLGECTALRWLNLGHTQVIDLEPLSKLVELSVLDLSGTDVADIGPLAPLRQLRELILRGSGVGSIRPLMEMRDIQLIDLTGTPAAQVPTPVMKSRWAHIMRG